MLAFNPLCPSFFRGKYLSYALLHLPLLAGTRGIWQQVGAKPKEPIGLAKTQMDERGVSESYAPDSHYQAAKSMRPITRVVREQR